MTRKRLLPAAIAFVVLASCAKEKDALADLRQSIAGEWELERTITWTGPVPPSPPGNGQIIVLREDGTVQRKQHDIVLFDGRYFLQTKEDCHPRTSNTLFQTTENGSPVYIAIENDKLSFSTPNCYADGGETIYRRIE